MGKLIEFPIQTLYGGVSRQPDPIRHPNQVQTADNVVFSVVSGGFTRRFGSAVDDKLNLTTYDSAKVHWIDRDANERYCVVLTNNAGTGDLQVFDLDGVEKTVTFPDGKTYLNDPVDGYRFVTVSDYTFIANTAVQTALLTNVAVPTINGPVTSFDDLPADAEVPVLYLQAAYGAGAWAKGVTTGYTAGDIWLVSNSKSEYDDYYVQYNATDDKFDECTHPHQDFEFDNTTMPYQLVREASGDFIFQLATWEPREVGDDLTVPPPDFVGLNIEDLFFHRNRFGILADENVYFSKAGDYLDMWPDNATEVFDSDPVGLTASTNRISKLKYAEPFRKALFVSARKAQFEVTGDAALTPKTAAISFTTAYELEPLARPFVMGDELYFASRAGNDAVVLEYYYSNDSLSNTAGDTTKHVQGYIPASITQIEGDPSSGTLWLRTDDELNTIYVYSAFWDLQEKVQSAWSRWTFGDGVEILGITYIDSFLRMVIKRGNNTILERIPLEESIPPEFPNPVHLDQKVINTGTYDAGNDWTTWTVDYEHDDLAQVLTTQDFPANQMGQLLPVTYPSTTTIRATGDYTSGYCIIGTEYESRVTMSKQFAREQDGSSILNGRLQMRSMSFSYSNTGYFDVEVTPIYRDKRTYSMTGRIIGELNNTVGSLPPVISGVFKVPIRAEGDSVQIDLVSSSWLPMTITSAAWVGFFNEITRQG